MNPVMSFKFLVYLGVHKPTVKVEFQKGLNVIYGASDTGKTFILQSLNFMLGAKKLRSIPESKGYTDILLGIEFSSGEAFTLNRKISGGHFFVYEGLHTKINSDIKGDKLDKQHKEGSLNTLST
ncbi:AAA family ATPase, partial [Acinetobacter sp. ABJ-A23_2]|uniref:AAA family ATPase n=1 Tax=Acinetobacter sp. ABJ-A23_2 TaxID=3376991 RepID=UPI0037CCA297